MKKRKKEKPFACRGEANACLVVRLSVCLALVVGSILFWYHYLIMRSSTSLCFFFNGGLKKY